MVSEIVGLGTEIFDEIMVDKLWPGTLALAQGHLDAGERVWLVTAAPVELATIMAQRLGFTGALGTVSEIVDGVYTGKLVGHPLHGPAKAEAVRALAARTQTRAKHAHTARARARRLDLGITRIDGAQKHHLKYRFSKAGFVSIEDHAKW